MEEINLHLIFAGVEMGVDPISLEYLGFGK
jgi:hypothetical protein